MHKVVIELKHLRYIFVKCIYFLFKSSSQEIKTLIIYFQKVKNSHNTARSAIMKINKTSLIILLLILPLMSFAQMLDDLAIMSKKSDVIVTGKVKQKKSAWNKNKSRIYTNVTLEVDETMKGADKVNSLELTYPGGEVDGVGELYSHMPKFEDNEEVLVFLKRDHKKETYNVYSGGNGKISIISDKKTGEKMTPSRVNLKILKAEIKSYINQIKD